MNYLPVVADKLCTIARSSSNREEADAFGRSAFNRYYYATFLSARDLLECIDRSWRNTPHSQIPDRLARQLVQKIGQELKKSKGHGIVTSSRASTLNSQIRSACDEIANVLRDAKMVREVADYEPEIYVAFNENTFTLQDRSNTEARGWLRRVDQNKVIVLRIAKEVGLV